MILDPIFLTCPPVWELWIKKKSEDLLNKDFFWGSQVLISSVGKWKNRGTAGLGGKNVTLFPQHSSQEGTYMV